MEDVAKRLANRVQLTTDGLKSYLSAVDDAFDNEIDYAQLIKVYGAAPEGGWIPACGGMTISRTSYCKCGITYFAKRSIEPFTFSCGIL